MDEKASQLRKYFARFPKWTIVVIALGLLVLTSGDMQTIITGIVLAAIGGWRLYSWTQKPTDAQVDAWVDEALKKIKSRALQKTGIDESELVAESVAVYGPRFWNIGGADVGIKKGTDGVIRFMPLGVTVLNFTQNQLTAYQCALDLATGNPLNESTDEYFYRDVVSVSTHSKSLTWDSAALGAKALSTGPLKALVKAGKLQFNAAEIFSLTTSGGTSIEVVLRDPTLIEKSGGGSIPTDMADKAVQAVRKMLRDKKAASAHA
jgi:hypothetical protein